MLKQVKGSVKAFGVLQSGAKAQIVRLMPIVTLRYWLSFNMTKLVKEALQTNQTTVAVKVYFLICCTIQVSLPMVHAAYLIYLLP